MRQNRVQSYRFWFLCLKRDRILNTQMAEILNSKEKWGQQPKTRALAPACSPPRRRWRGPVKFLKVQRCIIKNNVGISETIFWSPELCWLHRATRIELSPTQWLSEQWVARGLGVSTATPRQLDATASAVVIWNTKILRRPVDQTPNILNRWPSEVHLLAGTYFVQLSKN